jgi:hypothetical protein
MENMNLDLGFLANVQLEMPAKKSGGGSKKDRQPTEADLRLFKNGALYPSSALIAEFNLEYIGKNEEVSVDGRVPMGLDFIASPEWGMYPKGLQALAFVGITPKTIGKVDAFKSVGYDENGAPVKSVAEQGSTTAGKILIDVLGTAYGVKVEATADVEAHVELPWVDDKYIDLIIVRDQKMQTLEEVYHLPKKASRGENKGELSTVRREKIAIHPLVIKPVEFVAEKDVTEQPVEEVQTVVEETPNGGVPTPGETVMQETTAEVFAEVAPAVEAPVMEAPVMEAPIMESTAVEAPVVATVPELPTIEQLEK